MIEIGIGIFFIGVFVGLLANVWYHGTSKGGVFW